MLARPTLGLFSIENVLKIDVQQFIIFTENVDYASLFLSETCLHKLSNTNVVIFCKIVRYSKDLGIAGYLPTARESYDGLSLQSEKFCHDGAVP